MRSVLVAFLTALLGYSAWGDILPSPFEPKQFDEATYRIFVYDWMQRVAVKDLTSQSYDFAFESRDQSVEIRYILFAQTKPTANHRLAVRGWALAVTLNIAGNASAVRRTTEFKDDAVKAEFNADYGLTAFVSGGSSDFNSRSQVCHGQLLLQGRSWPNVPSFPV